MSQYNSRRGNIAKAKGAVALGYNVSEDAAPRVLAKGKGEVAEKIIEIAKENKIIIQEDALLYDSLYKLEIGDEIPVRLYQAVAELLSFVYRVNSKKKRGIV